MSWSWSYLFNMCWIISPCRSVFPNFPIFQWAYAATTRRWVSWPCMSCVTCSEHSAGALSIASCLHGPAHWAQMFWMLQTGNPHQFLKPAWQVESCWHCQLHAKTGGSCQTWRSMWPGRIQRSHWNLAHPTRSPVWQFVPLEFHGMCCSKSQLCLGLSHRSTPVVWAHFATFVHLGDPNCGEFSISNLGVLWKACGTWDHVSTTASYHHYWGHVCRLHQWLASVRSSHVPSSYHPWNRWMNQQLALGQSVFARIQNVVFPQLQCCRLSGQTRWS